MYICDHKQLLDEGFVTSKIIKVKVSVISLSRRLQLITVTKTLIVWISHKRNPGIISLHTVLKKMSTNILLHRTQFIFDKACAYFTVRELDNLTSVLELHV